MIKLENTEVVGFEAAIRGMRNPMNSHDKSDSLFGETRDFDPDDYPCSMKIGPNDLELMQKLRNAGTDHRKYLRMIVVYVDITAPLYWWKEFDTYKIGTVGNSCSTMHKITEKEFTLDDFSHEHLTKRSLNRLKEDIEELNDYRSWYLRYDSMSDADKVHFEDGINCKKDLWWQIIQRLGSNYNQKRTEMVSYEVLANMYKSRKHHKQDEWALSVENGVVRPNYGFVSLCDWIKTLPYSELITGEE